MVLIPLIMCFYLCSLADILSVMVSGCSLYWFISDSLVYFALPSGLSLPLMGALERPPHPSFQSHPGNCVLVPLEGPLCFLLWWNYSFPSALYNHFLQLIHELSLAKHFIVFNKDPTTALLIMSSLLDGWLIYSLIILLLILTGLQREPWNVFCRWYFAHILRRFYSFLSMFLGSYGYYNFAEILSLLQGIKLAADYGLSHFLVRSDSLMLINCILGKNHIPLIFIFIYFSNKIGGIPPRSSFVQN